MQANIIAYLATCEDETAGWNRKVFMAIKGPTELFTGKLQRNVIYILHVQNKKPNKATVNEANAIER